MTKKQPNPQYSPVVQALLDLQAVGVDTDALLRQIQNDKPTLKKADDLYDSHQYPNRVLKYAQISNYNETRALTSILKLKGGSSALDVFILATRIIGQELTFQLSTNGIADITGMSKKTVLNSIKLLKKYGFIATVKDAISKQAAVYMINPALVNVGKPKSCNTFNALAGDIALARLRRLNDTDDNYRIANISYKDQSGKICRCNTLIATANKDSQTEKEPSANDTDDSEINNLFN